MKLPVLIACKRTDERVPHTRKDEECLNFFSTLAPEVRAVLIDFHPRCGTSAACPTPSCTTKWHQDSMILTDICIECVSVGQKSLCQDVLSQCASKHGLTLLLHKILMRTSTDFENIVTEGCTQTLDETFACLGRRAKSSKSLSSSSRSWRTSLTFVVTLFAQRSNTLEMITCWEHRNHLRPSSFYA